jgi:hypothetical protein
LYVFGVLGEVENSVIPAQAGIQLRKNSRASGTTPWVLSASQNIFSLDSGLRRNDGSMYFRVKPP